MYDVYSLIIYSETGVITAHAITLDTDATLSELCDKVRSLLARNEEYEGPIKSYDIYIGDLVTPDHICWEEYTPIALDIC